VDRGAITLRVRDAITSTVLEGATVTVYNKTTNALVGSAVVTPISTIDPVTGLVVLHFVDAVDIINLSTVGSPVYMPKVSASNYTASPQQAFVGYLLNPDGSFTPTPGKILDDGLAEVPPKSANFTLVGGNMNDASSIISRFGIWLPSDNKYIVSINHGNANYGDPTIAPYGSLNEHPFARWMMQYFLETIVIRNRPTDTAAPYYPGDYLVGLTDNATKGPNDLDTGNVSVMVWKDGVIKKRVDKGTTLCGPLAHWWFPLQISSGASGAATYDKPYSMVCGAWLNSPYQ
jgi:hypothetical protein